MKFIDNRMRWVTQVTPVTQQSSACQYPNLKGPPDSVDSTSSTNTFRKASDYNLNQGKQPEYLKDLFCQDYIARIKKKRPTGGIPRGEPATAHKVIWFEAKRPEGTEPSRETMPNENDWEEVRSQIRDYMITARASDGDVQRMYGVTAIGMYARMFELPRHSDRFQAVDDGRTFHVEADGIAIEKLIQGWVEVISDGNNR